MDEQKRLEMELKPIKDVGDARAKALVEASITLEILATTPVDDILSKVKESRPNPDVPNWDLPKWQEEAKALLELYKRVKEILNQVEDRRAKDPSVQVEVYFRLANDGIKANNDNLEELVKEVYGTIITDTDDDDGVVIPDVEGDGDADTPDDEGDNGDDTPVSDEGENGMENEPLFVRDILAGNQANYRKLEERVHILERKKKDQDDELEPDLEQELIAATAILGIVEPHKLVIDPLFKAVKDYQSSSCQHEVPDHADGVFSYAPNAEDDVLTVVAMYGIMQRENHKQPDPGQRFPNAINLVCDILAEGDASPPYTILHPILSPDFKPKDYCGDPADRPMSRRFSNALALAQAEYNRYRDLYKAVFEVLQEEYKGEAIEAEKWARVTGVLAARGISHKDPLLALRAREALAGQISADDGGFPSGIEISLPDLEADSEVEILKDNLLAMQAIYFAAMLENANVFQVRDVLMNSFRSGLLPFGRGRAGDILYNMIRETPNRLSEYDRRNLYARTLGFAGGDAHTMPNRDFQMLWLRFVSAVSTFARQLSVDNLMGAGIPMRVRQEQIKKAGRDLAANLSLYAYGVTYFAATELQQQINEAIDLLKDEEVKMAYGARDMWSVVEQVSALELGGPRDTIRYRTMAGAGAIIIRWLAEHAPVLADVGTGGVLDIAEISRPRVRPVNSNPTTDPFDSDLVNACERWLAVTGTPEQQVEDYAGASEGPVLTSQPVRIPSAARDMLDSIGVNGGPGSEVSYG